MTTPVLPDPAEFERILRDKYEPLVSAEDYARLRKVCGLGGVIDGEIVARFAVGNAIDELDWSGDRDQHS